MDYILRPNYKWMGVNMELIIEINMKAEFDKEDGSPEQIRVIEREKIYASLKPYLNDGWIINVQTKVVEIR